MPRKTRGRDHISPPQRRTSARVQDQAGVEEPAQEAHPRRRTRAAQPDEAASRGQGQTGPGPAPPDQAAGRGRGPTGPGRGHTGPDRRHDRGSDQGGGQVLGGRQRIHVTEQQTGNGRQISLQARQVRDVSNLKLLRH